jgi:hypothetical protein
VCKSNEESLKNRESLQRRGSVLKLFISTRTLLSIENLMEFGRNFATTNYHRLWGEIKNFMAIYKFYVVLKTNKNKSTHNVIMHEYAGSM